MFRVAINETRYGTMMYPHNDLAFILELVKGKIYEQDMIEMLLAPTIKASKIILDVGAHCGSHSVIYAKLNPDAKIFAFEPQKKMFLLLNMNLRNNGITNVTTIQAALGNKICNATMNASCVDGPTTNQPLDDGHLFNLGGLQIGEGGEPIKILTMDSINFNGKVDYIKIDTEGFESFVLSGGLATITRDKPIIFFEHNDKVVTPQMAGFYEPIDYNIMSKLSELKYSFTAVEGGNYLALPSAYTSDSLSVTKRSI